MGNGVNRQTIIGNLGADPDLRFTQGGTAVLNLRVAATTGYLDSNKERKERTEWFSVVVWGKRAEGLAKFLSKGDTIFAEGETRTSEYEKEGQKHYRSEVHAFEIVPMSKGKGDRDDDRGRDSDRGRRDDDRGRDRGRDDDRRRDSRDTRREESRDTRRDDRDREPPRREERRPEEKELPYL